MTIITKENYSNWPKSKHQQTFIQSTGINFISLRRAFIFVI